MQGAEDWQALGAAVGVLGGIVTTVGSAIWALRKLWRSERVASAEAAGAVGSFAQLYRLLDDKDGTIKDLREALAAATQRIDEVSRERNELVRLQGAQQVRVETLTEHARQQQARIHVLEAQTAQLMAALRRE